MTGSQPDNIWPVALERDIRPTGLARACIRGEDLVIWRNSDDVVHVWEDRCPHRSVRLSAGRNLGDSLQCIYHGWCFARNGGVVDIPAQANEARPDIKVKVWWSMVSDGLVWVSPVSGAAGPDNVAWIEDAVLLRPLSIKAPAETVEAALSKKPDVRFYVTPAAANWCLVFGHARRESQESETRCVRRFDRQMTILRRKLEAGAAQ